jgi:endo-1,4-beta-xylanase
MFKNAMFFVFASGGVSCCFGQQVSVLKEVYRNYFTIGVAVSPRALKTAEAELFLRQFGSMTAENAMKMGPILPGELFLKTCCFPD